MLRRRLNVVRHHWPTVLLFVVGLCATFVVRSALSRTILTKDTIRFTTATERTAHEITVRVDAHVELLRAVAALLTVEPNLDARALDRFVGQIGLQSKFPGVESIAFARAGTNAASDLVADPISREAMARARDTGSPAATGSLQRPPRFHIYFPVYDGALPPNSADRAARLRGFVYATFSPDRLFTGTFGATAQPRPFVTYALFDGDAAPQNLLFRSELFPAEARFAGAKSFDVYGRQWTAVVRSMPSMDDASSQELVDDVFAAGVLLTVVLTALIAMQTQARRRVERSEKRVQHLLRNERSLREESERVGRVKDEFLATLSHELRTPLNAIVGWSRLMSDPELPQDVHGRALEAVQRNAQVQSQLIGDLLDMSRIISGKVLLDMKVVDPVEIVEAAVTVVRPTAEAKGLVLDAQIDGTVPPLRGDAARLQQILWNLLNNAMKFTPSGGHVTVHVRRSDADVVIAVADTGAGIEESFLPHVFERFRQADASTTRQHGGLGLGLSIVKNLVEMHGGTIAAASAGPGRGSTFTVSLPACSRAPVSHAAPRHPTAALDAHHALLGRRILVVDDDADARELLNVLLLSSGATVLLASSAAEALRRMEVEGATIDLVLSDLGMPQMDGLELLRRLRTLPAARGGAVPAVAVSAYARSEDRLAAVDAGYQLHISKPYDPEELIAVCASAISSQPAQAPPAPMA